MNTVAHDKHNFATMGGNHLKDHFLYQTPCMQNPLFPVCISFSTFGQNEHAFLNHWHEHSEFLNIKKGEGIIECNSVSYHVKLGDLIIVNSNELHSGYSLSNNFSYYCIIVDPSVLHSNFVGLCEIKYISPITQNLILLKI